MQTLSTDRRPALTFDQADQLVALIYDAIRAKAAYEQAHAADIRLGGLAAWHERVDTASEADRGATSAAVNAVRDLARGTR